MAWPLRFFFLLLLFSLTACYRLNLQSFLDESVLFNQEQILKGQRFEMRKHFYREKQLEYVFGYSEAESTVLNRILTEETAGQAGQPNGGVINLRIVRTYRPLDAVVSLLTLGIYTRNWLIVEGDVIVWKELSDGN
ncbi:MAG: hypothetical protein IV090_21720 [Candidatus Sericytochromatia bacterium]|nr:hypothetical protein [Candidatus Sericytochromatia bacterium]